MVDLCVCVCVCGRGMCVDLMGTALVYADARIVVSILVQIDGNKYIPNYQFIFTHHPSSLRLAYARSSVACQLESGSEEPQSWHPASNPQWPIASCYDSSPGLAGGIQSGQQILCSGAMTCGNPDH